MRKLALAALGGAIALAPVHAQPVPTEYRVGHADLDLASKGGRAKLDRRILTAAQAGCGPTFSFDVEGRNKVRRCIRDTLAAAKPARDLAVAAARSPAYAGR